MATKLKPCPYCGEAEHLYPSYRMKADGTLIGPHAIDCLGCGHDFVPREGADVVSAWNRRSDPAADLLEEAGNALEELLKIRSGRTVKAARATLSKIKGAS